MPHDVAALPRLGRRPHQRGASSCTGALSGQPPRAGSTDATATPRGRTSCSHRASCTSASSGGRQDPGGSPRGRAGRVPSANEVRARLSRGHRTSAATGIERWMGSHSSGCVVSPSPQQEHDRDWPEAVRPPGHQGPGAHEVEGRSGHAAAGAAVAGETQDRADGRQLPTTHHHRRSRPRQTDRSD